MKTPAVLLWFLATLLLCGLTGWEAYRKGKESLGREQMMDIIEDNRAAMQEVRHAYTDFSRVINVNRPGFPGECFICELRLPDHCFRWKHNKLFLFLSEEYGPAFSVIVDCYTSPPT